jgi:acylphosphatase
MSALPTTHDRDPLVRLNATVEGRVQGVGFRWWVQSQARARSLVGWVANSPDERSVEVVAEGPPGAIAELEELLRVGPPGARVERVKATRGPASGTLRRFEIVRP